MLPPAAARAQPAPAPQAPQAPQGPSGRIRISQTQASLLGSIAWGGGTLTFQGHSHRFRIRGIGVGGLGFTQMTAAGEVYDLTDLRDFPGLYGQARAGAVAGSAQVQGGIWLQNTAGVRIHLHPERQGLALQVGADGMLIEME
jgi:hypothetical protein